MNKKKLLVSLLGGGVATVACTLGGLKLNDKISYDRQISYYRKLASDFGDKGKLTPDPHQGKFYLPEWLDDAAWKRTHDNRHAETGEEHARERKKFLEAYPKWEDFKRYCYNMAQSGKYNICTDTTGWCEECARREGWEWDKKRT